MESAFIECDYVCVIIHSGAPSVAAIAQNRAIRLIQHYVCVICETRSVSRFVESVNKYLFVCIPTFVSKAVSFRTMSLRSVKWTGPVAGLRMIRNVHKVPHN